MARKSKAKFEMEGHTLPGINQKSETVNKKDGRSPSSAFQQKSPLEVDWKGILTGGLSNVFGKKKGGNGEEEEGGKLLKDTGKTVSKTTGFTVSGGGDATGDTTGDVTGDTTAATTEMEPAGGGTATTGTETEEEV